MAFKVNRYLGLLQDAMLLWDLLHARQVAGHKSYRVVAGFRWVQGCFDRTPVGWNASTPSTHCVFNQGGVTPLPFSTPVGAGVNNLRIVGKNLTNPSNNDGIEGWQRTTVGVTPTIQAVPLSYAEEWWIQLPWPAIDPFSLPIGTKPANFPTPLPIPWRMIPDLAPSPFRERFYDVRPGTRTRTRVTVDTKTRTWEVVKIEFPQPETGPSFIIGPPSIRKPVDQRHKMQPPRAKEKESKYVVRIAGVVARIINVATEGLDVLEALYDALPCELVPHYILRFDRAGGMKLPEWRKPKPGEMTAGQKHPKPYYQKPGKAGDCIKLRVPVKRKMELLYRHWDKVDMQKAIQNLVENEIEDRLYGGLGKAQGRAAQNAAQHGYSGRPVGTEFGPAL